MKELLKKAETADFEFILATLSSHINFSNDSKLRKLLDDYARRQTDTAKYSLITKIELEIRYAGSADLAYLYRWLFKGGPGVPPDEVISDVSKKLKVKQKLIGTNEAKLERLVKAVVEKKFLELSDEEKRGFLKKQGCTDSKINELLAEIKKRGKIAVIPIIIKLLGPKVAENLVNGIIIALISQIVGKEAAKKLVVELTKRFPLWAEWLGPVVWGITFAWIAYDLQGPAYRKTIPIMLYLGLVALRDGSIEDENFLSQSEDG